MDRAVVYTILATGLFLFIVFSPRNNSTNNYYYNQNNGPFRLSLNRRLGYKFPIPKFDPLLLKLEKLADEKRLANTRGGESKNSGQEHDDDDDDEDDAKNKNDNDNDNDHVAVALPVDDKDKEFFDDNGRLNITLRLLVLFPLVDTSPKDGKVSFEELERWNIEQTKDQLYYRTQREMELHDEDGDGAISFHEFLPRFSPLDIAKNEMGHGEAGWWMEQFRNADADRNGTLNFDEFNERMDDDKDGKLNQDEFSRYAYPSYSTYAEFETATVAQIPTQEDKFHQLDLNNDRLLDVRELIPMLGYLKPGELAHARYYTGFLMHEADDDGDGFLTIEEMLDHEQTFYGTVYGDNQEYDDYYHNEL